jgi:hypothetical protein
VGKRAKITETFPLPFPSDAYKMLTAQIYDNYKLPIRNAVEQDIRGYQNSLQNGDTFPISLSEVKGKHLQALQESVSKLKEDLRLYHLALLGVRCNDRYIDCSQP